MAEQNGSTGARILLIEDEATVARLTETVLASAGYTVEIASDHATASERLSQDGYDLVLTDTEEGPRASGLEGLAPLVEASTCPVILFSAHRFPTADIAAAGFAGVVHKPFDIDDLLKIVDETLATGATS